MKRKMKKWLVILPLLAILIGGGTWYGLTAFGDENDQVYEDVRVGLQQQIGVGVIPGDLLAAEMKADAVSPENGAQLTQQMQTAAEKAPVDFSEHFSEPLATKYEDIHQEIIENPNLDSVTVDSGILDLNFEQTDSVSGSEKNVPASYVPWILSVEKREEQYVVTLIMSRVTCTVHTILEDGVWKLVDFQNNVQEFYPDTYDPVKGTFDTFEEALEYALTVNVEAENPF